MLRNQGLTSMLMNQGLTSVM